MDNIQTEFEAPVGRDIEVERVHDVGYELVISPFEGTHRIYLARDVVNVAARREAGKG